MRRLPSTVQRVAPLWMIALWVLMASVAFFLIASVSLAHAQATTTPAPTLLPTPTFATAPVTFIVTGRVSSGTAGVSVPAGLEFALNLVTTDAAGRANIQRQTGTLPADMVLRFNGVRAIPGTTIFLTTTFEGVTQGSLVTQVQNEQGPLDLPVTLYAGTTDATAITIVRAQQILEFQSGNVMQVLATYLLGNAGDRFYLSVEKNAQGGPLSVALPLPIGAGAVAFSNNLNNRFVVGGTLVAPIVQDTRPIMPGQPHEIIVSYQVPYDKGAPIDQDYPFITQMVEVLIPDDARVKLTGDFAALPNISINPQRSYTQYNLTKPVAAGGRLVYTLEGIPPAQATRPIAASNDTANNAFSLLPLLICTAGMVIAGIVIVAFLFRPRRP